MAAGARLGLLLALAAACGSEPPQSLAPNRTNAWGIVRKLGLEGVAAASGPTALSPDQEFAAVCGLDGSLTVLRVTLYPNLYPDWPYLVYGWHSRAELRAGAREASARARCWVSQQGARVLSVREAANGALSVTVFARGSVVAGRKDSPQFCTRADRSWDPSGFVIRHPRDPYNDAWAPVYLVPDDASGGAGAYGTARNPEGTIMDAALSPDGKWVAVLVQDVSGSARAMLVQPSCSGEAARQLVELPQASTSAPGRLLFGADARSLALLPGPLGACDSAADVRGCGRKEGGAGALAGGGGGSAAQQVPVAEVDARGAWALSGQPSLVRGKAARSGLGCVRQAQAVQVGDAGSAGGGDVLWAAERGSAIDAATSTVGRELVVVLACDGAVSALLHDREARSLSLLQSFAPARGDPPTSLAVGASGRLFAIAGSDSVQLWEWSAHRVAFTLLRGPDARPSGWAHGVAIAELKWAYLVGVASAPAARVSQGAMEVLEHGVSEFAIARCDQPMAGAGRAEARRQDFYVTPSCAFPVDRSVRHDGPVHHDDPVPPACLAEMRLIETYPPPPQPADTSYMPALLNAEVLAGP
jgi:hypothetical protein